MNAIEINKEISTILSSIGNLSYFPLVIPENTKLPTAVYERSITYDNNNDFYTADVNVSIDVLSSTYSESISLLNSIVEKAKEYKYKLSSVEEDFTDGIFIQRLNITKILT